MPLPLPREFIEQILQAENSTKHHLAKICLLNSSFLDFGRRLLYYSVQVTIIGVDTVYDYSGDDSDRTEQSIVLQYLEDRSAGLFRVLHSKPALAALVKNIGFEHYGTADYYEGARSDFWAQDPEALMCDILSQLPNVKSIKLPRYVGAYDAITHWYTASPRPMPEHLDARAVGIGPLRLVGSFQDVKHLSFTSKAKFPVLVLQHFFPEELLKLRLESLHIARPDPDMQDVFHHLTASSASTLRTLRLPWHPQGSPRDFSALSSLAFCELSQLSDTPCDRLVQAFATFQLSLISLSLLSPSSTPFSDLDLVAQHIPSRIVSLELPHLLDSADMIRFVDHLPSESKVRFLSVEGSQGGQARLAGVRAACEARGVAFSTFRRHEIL